MTIRILCGLAYPAEIVALFLYCKKMFSTKTEKSITIFSLIVGSIFLWLISALEQPLLNSILFFLVSLVYIRIVCRTNWKTALFHAGGLSIMLGSAELTARLCFIRLLAGQFLNTANTNIVYPLYLYTGKLLFLLFAMAFSRYLKKTVERTQMTLRGYAELFVAPAFTLFILLMLVRISQISTVNEESGRLLALTSIGLLLQMAGSYRMYRLLEEKNEKILKDQTELQRNAYMKEYHQMLLGKQQERSILIHDIRKHLNAIRILNEAGQPSKVEDYLEELLKSDAMAPLVRSDCDLFNAILEIYAGECRQKHILFQTDIRRGAVSRISDADMIALFCNILDNAVYACENCDRAFIELNASYNPKLMRTTIAMQNSFDSNAKDSGHGYGLKSVEKTAQKYQGYMETYSSDGDTIYHTVIVLHFA